MSRDKARSAISLKALLDGLLITLGQFGGAFGGRNTVTIQYPKKKRQPAPRFRGLHRLERYEEGPFKGLEKCIGCALCAAACPAEVITVVAAENTEFVYFLCPNLASYAFLSDEVKQDPAVFLPAEIREKSEVIRDLGPQNALYTKAWDEIKSAK